MLANKAESTIAKIDNNNFRPRRYIAKRGDTRRFSLTPQHNYTWRYAPIDITILQYLASSAPAEVRAWYPVDLRNADLQNMSDETKASMWTYFFDFKKVHGTCK